MRLLVSFALLVVPCVLLGWPSRWWLALPAFAAGLIGRRPLEAGPRRPHGGSTRPPVSPVPSQADTSMSDLTRRIGGYSSSPTAPGSEPGETATRRTPPAPSSSGGRSWFGDQTAAAGASGLQLAAAAYRERLTAAQAELLDGLTAEALERGELPPDTWERMAAGRPWPDPYSGGAGRPEGG